ncbi:GIN domain-containing protein [Pedobacter sp. ASV12]|uniref:GIN domain-containing protein n=1 Tax=Pedobacter sp. ASV12 TaxID=2795120 RepID=UPI0018EE1AF7|nr:DUF2807 domain-containing protein [Pedobacter sp. ASV12]
MKTAIKTLFAIALTTVLSATVASTVKAADNNTITVLSEVKKVNKINVSGNVEVILVQSPNESVKVYDNYYAKNALVQQQDGELRISSFNKETLTVVVYVSNLSTITASDNAKVSTYGKFNTLSLEVNLKDNAAANLNTNTINLNSNLSGQANLTLAGSTSAYNATMGSVAKVNLDQFAAESTSIQSQNVVVAKTVATLNDIETADLVSL